MGEKNAFRAKTNDDIQAKLDKKLGPEYISKRVGFGSSRVAYIEGWRAINLANQIFGYNGWSTEVKSVTVDFLDERQGKYSIGCTAIVRVTLQNGTYREDIGYGTVENERRKAAAFERAKKSAVTDALKRSLRGFGNALGNCLYDKDFLARIDKVQFDPPDFDEGNLFRPSDEISEISRSNTLDHQLDGSCKRRRVTRPGPAPGKGSDSNGMHNQQQSLARPVEQRRAQHPENPPDQAAEAPAEHDELLDDSLMFSDDFQDDDLINMGKQQAEIAVPEQKVAELATEPITFVTAKAASSVQNKRPVTRDNVFDPKYQAQSIKHTVDQTTSMHIPASLLKEKGIDDSRESAYHKFAPKGKQIGVDTSVSQPSNDNRTSNSTSQPVAAASSRFAPPNTVVHPNSSSAIPQPAKATRREVGRPKINPSMQRKLSP
ncbi:hypothetical protein HG536_0A05960 [Torulaspora globosa]|uniref:DNA repair and recombination protein RAD52 n=1 Tax=Torulaspora globosa TaxID=48254 RepID=A0A7G3ZB95_9SACH|nr:uncharacterized protein HG536_0A05960 [Torulaspora globosa]QLL30781.1 hypothetical protein HG536_0A05960 [Torulaspora globosa]